MLLGANQYLVYGWNGTACRWQWLSHGSEWQKEETSICVRMGTSRGGEVVGACSWQRITSKALSGER